MSDELAKRYSKLYLDYIELIQKYEQDFIPTHLCLSPLGTNIMLLASELRMNTKIRCKTTLVQGVYDFDIKVLERFNRENKTDHQALPWVLQRYDDHYKDPNPWTIWFRDLNDNDLACENYEERLIQLEDELWQLRDRIDDPDLLELGICVNYATRFNSETHALVSAHDYVTGHGPCVAVHIRRGDAWNETLDIKDPGREHFELEKYTVKMEEYANRGFHRFYVLSESQRVVDELTEHFSGRCEVISQKVDRSLFPTPKGSAYGFKDFVEFKCLTNPDLLKFLLQTAIVDIYNASLCDAFIGTFSSQFSLLNYLAIIGNKKSHVPFHDLSDTNVNANISHPNLSDRQPQGPGLIIIKGNCCFEVLIRVIEVLLYLEEQSLRLIPYIYLSDDRLISLDRNLWNSVFEDLVPLKKPLIQKRLERFNKYYRKERDRVAAGEIIQIKPKLYWAHSLAPALSSKARNDSIIAGVIRRVLQRFMSPQVAFLDKCTPTSQERRVASRVIGKFIRARRSIRNEVDEFFRHYFSNCYVIGVHFTPSDALIGKQRKRKYEEFRNGIESHIRSFNTSHKKTGVFVATNDQSFLSFLVRTFENVQSFKSYGHRSVDPVKDGGEGALKSMVMDYLALCRCKMLFHCPGPLSEMVLLTKPDLPSRLVRG